MVRPAPVGRFPGVGTLLGVVALCLLVAVAGVSVAGGSDAGGIGTGGSVAGGGVAGPADGGSGGMALDDPNEGVSEQEAVTGSTDDWTTDGASENGSATSQQADRTIRLSQELRLTPDRPGSYDAHHVYDLPSEVSGLNLSIEPRATVVASDGFERTGSRAYAWDESTQRPTLTLRVDANRTADETGPIGTGGGYRFVDVGEWALVTRPQVQHGWQWRGGDITVGFDREMTVAGEGAAGEVIAYLGPAETVTQSAHGQTVRLVVPASADLAESRSAVFDSVLSASDSLRVGDRDESVLLVAAPTGQVEWGVRGVQVGDSDAWVAADEPLDEPRNVWLHEYVHTRQSFVTEPDARWLTEAMASYYSARLSLEQERISFDAFRAYLDRGTSARYANAVLADPSTWQDDPDYEVGALVTGELDRRTRVATDSAASFDHVFRRLNRVEGDVGASDFLAELEAVAGGSVADAGERYTTTTERPDPWDATAHGEAFGTTPARFEYSYAEEGFVVSGPYRNGTLASEGPLVVVPGESLSVSVSVANEGGAEGQYEAALTVDGAAVEQRTGTLAPNETASHEFDWTAESTGQYALAVGGREVQVNVREPAEPQVTGFDADPRTIDAGDSVTLSIEVSNEADRPAEATVPVTRDGQTVAERSVRLDVDETATLTVPRRLEESGEYTFGLGEFSDRTVTVEVTESFPTALLVAGGGVVLGLLVILVIAAQWIRRR